MKHPLFEEDNVIEIRGEVDLLEERRPFTYLMCLTIKEETTTRFNKRV